MRCPHCNAKNPDTSIFCTKCDAWILASVYQEKAPPAQSRRSKPAPKKWFLPIISCAVLLIAVLTVVLALPRSLLSPTTQSTLPPTTHAMLPPTTTQPPFSVSSGHILLQNSITPYTGEGKLSFLSNDVLLETEYTSYQSISFSLDGCTAAVLTDDQTLLCIRDDAIREVGQNVTHFILSANGASVAFMDASCSLSLYDTETRQNVNITNYSDDFVISPDGKVVAYMQNAVLSSAMDARLLFIYRNGESVRRSFYRDLTSLISISNDAEYVYTHTHGSILCNRPDGTTTTVGLATPVISNTESYLTLCNADHTQLLFYGSDGTYLSDSGQSAVQISSRRVYPVSPAQTDSAYHDYKITLSCHDLTAQIYYDYATGGSIFSSQLPSYNLWQFSADGVCQPLVSGAYYYWTDPTGRYTYYIDKARDLCLLDLQGGDAHPILASGVTQFAVAYDCSTVYYITDNTLYALSGSASAPQLIQSSIGSAALQITRDNRLYVLDNMASNFHSLYICKNGSLELVMEQIRSYSRTPTGMLYVSTTDAHYLCDADGKLETLRIIKPISFKS